MKILILSTFGNYGGAAVAAVRLKSALEKQDLDVRMGVFFSSNPTYNFLLFDDSFILRLKRKLLFIAERLQVLQLIAKRKYLYKYSIGQSGFDLINHPEVLAADVIHLHWVSFAFLGIKDIANLAKKKPVVWTLHDMWAFTGGCHYSLDCNLYTQNCSECFYLKKNSAKSRKILEAKLEGWNQIDLFKVVTCSHWLATCARRSKLFTNWNISTIGNPIDASIFRPLENASLKERFGLNSNEFYVLAGAMDLSDERKGMAYLIEAIRELSENTSDLHLLTFGKSENPVPGIKFTSFGQVSDTAKLVEIYNLADIFVLPSIQDNLPNTVMEAMACGLPVVAFDCGGVVDMVDHLKNGYLARNQDFKDLAKGITFFKSKKIRKSSSVSARNKIVSEFSELIIAEKYRNMYRSLLS